MEHGRRLHHKKDTGGIIMDNEYMKKVCTPKEAVSHIRSGDRVVVDHACGEPVVLTDAMVEYADEFGYTDVEVVHMVAMGKAEYCKPGMEKHFWHNGLFLGKTTSGAVYEGRGDFTPVYFSDIPDLLRYTIPPDVALIQVSKPDKHGYCSLGVSCDYTISVTHDARTVIAQVNDRMPRTFGDTFVHISEIDYIVEKDEQLIQLYPPKIGEVQKAIGENVAGLINDGDCLQLGIGAIPDAVLMFLKDKKHLGIHSEMFSDGVVDLINEGIIDNSMKRIHKGVSVVTFLMGTDKLYDFVDENPKILMMPVDYVNDPRVICQIDNMVSINSCVEVDLQGQVASESIGLRQISAVGGQVDFVRGANMSKGGRAIMAIPATAAGGKASRIVPFLKQGAAVTTSRCDVNYVVTEYGVAQLKGKTLRDRARALINVAAPQFRDELKEEFTKRFHEEWS